MMPFTHDQFFESFGAYNEALWPFAVTLWVLSAAAFVLVLRGRVPGWMVTTLLAVHWAWSGIAYHWVHFTAINPAAYGFAIGFMIQAALLAFSAWRNPPHWAWNWKSWQAVGAVIAGYGLLYPAIAGVTVNAYPLVPTFGVPCPTTLLTIGLLLMATPVRRGLLVIPALWAFIGGSAAILLGVLPDYALLAAGLAVVLATVAPRTIKTFVSLAKNVPATAGRVDLSSLAGVPQPVARCLRRVLTDGQPLIRAVRIRQAGEIRIGTDSGQWRRFTAEQLVVPPRRSFVWSAKVRMPPGIRVEVVDSYLDGLGSGRVSVLSVIPVARADGSPELNSGALHRYLAEMPWYPTALLPEAGVAWSPIDERTALATLSDHDTTVSVELRFDEAGDIVGMYTSGRWGRFGGTYQQMPWEGRFGDYRDVGGMRIPMTGEVGWHIRGKLELVWRGTITDLAYD